MQRQLVVLILLAAARAHAGDVWSDPYPGIRHLHRTTPTPWNIHALVVDLCASNIRVRATAPSEKGKTVSAFGKLVGAAAAVNADFFTFATFQPSGIDVGNGQAWPRNNDPTLTEAMVAFGPSRADVFPPVNVVSGSPPPWATEVVSSRPQVLKGGAVITKYNCNDGNNCIRDPRTGIGLSQDRQKLILAVVDGRQPALSAGMTQEELGTFMLELGASDAVSMDSGGSSEIWLASSGVLNSPSDGQERVVANHLAIVANASHAGSCTPSAADMAVLASDMAPPDLASGLADASGDAPDLTHAPTTDPSAPPTKHGGGCSYGGGVTPDDSLVLSFLLFGLWSVRNRLAAHLLPGRLEIRAR
jgi:hypothetical protein